MARAQWLTATTLETLMPPTIMSSISDNCSFEEAVLQAPQRAGGQSGTGFADRDDGRALGRVRVGKGSQGESSEAEWQAPRPR
jgi:hypothetical protein